MDACNLLLCWSTMTITGKHPTLQKCISLTNVSNKEKNSLLYWTEINVAEPELTHKEKQNRNKHRDAVDALTK